VNKCGLVIVFTFCLIHEVIGLVELIDVFAGFVIQLFLSVLSVPVFASRRTHLRVRTNLVLIETKQAIKLHYWSRRC
jgi:uncharacterized membrane protein YagU involved in acid resistance